MRVAFTALLFIGTALQAADCEVAMKYLSFEATGNFTEANKLLVLPAELNQFRDRPAFVIDKKPDSLTDLEYQGVRALGALIRFELVSCEPGFFGTSATIRVIRPDVLKLFPDRTEGVALRTPKDGSERQQWLSVLQSRFGMLSKIPMVSEIVPLPIQDSATGPKVGSPRL